MALYDYICYGCNRTDEVEKPMTSYGTPVICPKCGERMHRLWRGKAPGAHYRGNGWTGARKNG